MYKLKQELPKEFKIKVNRKQSEVLQKHLFSIGYGWGKVKEVDTFSKYLFAENLRITHLSDNDYVFFKQDALPRIKFKDYFEKVEETSFPEKWCILVTEYNYQELNTWMHRNWKNYPQYQDSWIILPLTKWETDKIFYSHANNSSLGGWSGKLNDIAEGFELITTEQFRAKYGDLKPKDCVFTIDSALEVDPRKLPIFSENNGVLPLEIKRLQSENDKLKHQILMLTEKLETIKKAIE